MQILVKLKQFFTIQDFKNQLVLAITIAILLTSIISTFVITKSSSLAISENLLERAFKVTDFFSEQAILGLLVANADNLERAVETTLQFPDVVAVGVYNLDKTTLLERGNYEGSTRPEKWALNTELVRQTVDAWYLVAPVFYEQESEDMFVIPNSEPQLLGYVSVVMNKSSLNSLVGGVRNINIITTFVLTLIMIFVLLSVTQRVTQPIKKLRTLMGRAQTGERRVRAELSGPNDIRQMEVSFNTMIAALEDREQELLSTRDDALQSAKVKGEFAANVSHELRTPLNGILGMLELLSDMPLSPKQREYVDIAQNSSDALVSLIDDILDFSKIDLGKVGVVNQEFDLTNLLDDVVSIMSTQAQLKGIDFSYQICEPLMNKVCGDRRRIRQLLINLCGNAIKFTNQGEVFIKVSLEQDDNASNKLRFEINDTGIGIPADALDKIFEAFSQADNSTTRRYGGTGLGLAICRQLVNVLDGEIGVDSVLGQGSKFFFVIPIPEVSTQLKLAATEHKGLNNKRFLVIDDSEHVYTNLAQILKRYGGLVDYADCGRAALSKLKQATESGQPFEIVLVDETMPSDDGIELLRLIKHDNTIIAPKTLLMTNHTYTEYLLERVAEIDQYIQKPIVESQLLTTLSVLIEGVSVVQAGDLQRAEEKEIIASNVKILVAEDNNANQKVAQGMLERLGCKVMIAYNGIEAIDLLMRDRFDIVFMDCNMPEMDGYEATRRIRKLDDNYAQIPIIAMTANVREGDRQTCIDAGMDDYLAKPLKIKNIKSKLEIWLPELVSEVLKLPTQQSAPYNPSALHLGALNVKRINELKDSVGRAFENVLSAFREDLAKLVDDIAVAIDAQNKKAIQYCAHTIKGSSKNFGAQELAKIAGEIERACKTEQLDKIDLLLKRLKHEMENVMVSLNKLDRHDHTGTIFNRSDTDIQKILIVDDDRSMRTALVNVLDATNYMRRLMALRQ